MPQVWELDSNGREVQRLEQGSSADESGWQIVPWIPQIGRKKVNTTPTDFAQEALKVALWAAVFISALTDLPIFIFSGAVGMVIPPKAANKIMKDVVKIWNDLPTEGKAIAAFGTIVVSVLAKIPIAAGVGGFYAGWRARQYIDSMG